MRARRLIDGASFGPDTLKVVDQAFDEAWAEIAGHVGALPIEVERARLRLAEAMAMDYRSGLRVATKPQN